ncbi:MAG: zinc ribbon domain-containing protein [Bryobacteraceae bacterium]|jgi:putative FmdB family regulatory protein
MPIYEYLCQDCGTKFEKLVRRQAETPELECPKCGEKRLKQELSTFAAHAGGAKSQDAPMCPSGGPCSNPGMCGMNFN